MGRRTLLLIASILVAALGTALIWLYVQGADNRGRQGAELVPALFFARSAEAGESAQAPGLTVTKLVPGTVADTAVTDPSALNGRALGVPALAGQILLPSMLTAPGQAGRFPEQGAMSISINEPNRVPADLRPGDLVDVYALTAGRVQPVLTCVRVRSIGSATGAPTGGTTTVPATIVGFDVTSAKAKRLYDIVAANAQPALYDHNPKVGC